MSKLKHKIAIFGMDCFRKTNEMQFECLYNNGLIADIFIRKNYFDLSARNNTYESRLIVLQSNPIMRLLHWLLYLLKNISKLHHVEVYTSSTISFLCVLLARILMLKVIVVERGTLVRYGRLNYLAKISLRFSYLFANVVWYKEYYMRRQLKKWGINKLFFLPNCVKIPNFQWQKKDIDFLWVNRLTSVRKHEWFFQVLRQDYFANTSNVLLGLLGKEKNINGYQVERLAINNAPKNLEICDYISPKAYYKRARFFVLPADVVFANNALLEAMSYGVIPLVSDVEGARVIVDHEVNGFVFEHSTIGLHKAMCHALTLPADKYKSMSTSAIEKVKNDFSFYEWSQKLLTLYDVVE